jgi:ketosteroid isomerase-like protein
MAVKPEDHNVVQGVFEAMHEGPKGEAKMMALFHDDAVLIEPFSGQPQTHSGSEAIRSWFKQATREMPPGMKITLDRIDMDGQHVRAEWTCTADVFPKPMKGYDLYAIRDGKIARLEMIVTDAPPMGPS